MNQAQGYMDMHAPPHMSSAQQYGSHPAPVSMPHYQYAQPVMHQGAPYQPGPSYGYGYANGVPSPQSAHPGGHVGSQVQPQSLPLPAMMAGPAPPSAQSYVPANPTPSPGYATPTHFDTSGQVAPPGMKPRVTATLWEDEGTLCFQVEAKGVCVARREDNHFINGTKLLNVAGMTRGRRDGILKSEKTRHVVKIGPMHLKGVWIPFERALDFANKEKITNQLYPLFVHNIGGLLYNPENANRTSAVVAATERRRIEGDNSRSSQVSQPASLTHHHSMTAQIPPSPHALAPTNNGSSVRPEMTRSQTFPTPPTSASSVLGMGANSGSYDWNSNNTTPGQPLSVDTSLTHPRSMPTTPATTPPGGSLQNLQSYSGQPGYDSTKHYYASAPVAQSQNGYSQPSRYSLKSDMGPPSAPGIGDNDQHEHKHDIYASHAHVSGPSDPGAHDHENGYMSANAAAYGHNRSAYGYHPVADHPHLSPEMSGSPSHQTGSGRGTPRTMPQQWPPEYQTPPRPAHSGYGTGVDSRASNGPSSGDSYGQYHTSAPATGKRGRDDDDHDLGRPSSRDYVGDFDAKRRKMGRGDTYGGPLGPAPQMQAIKTGGGMSRQR